MIEIPEAAALARQFNSAVKGRTILSAEANHSPHRFAWYTGDPAGYGVMLAGRQILEAVASGGVLELKLSGGLTLFFNDGPSLRLHKPGAKLPVKHQLLLSLDDGSAVTASVQMYGGMTAYPDGNVENVYLQGGRDKPNPLTDAFHRAYFDSLLAAPGAGNLSAKAFLATEQRIPGLGNGVLQDILYNAGIHPRRKMATLSPEDLDRLYHSLKETLAEMDQKGGRDTETDLYGLPGGYQTKLSRHTVGSPCTICGSTIKKEPYLGGAIYWCPGCQVAPEKKG